MRASQEDAGCALPSGRDGRDGIPGQPGRDGIPGIIINMDTHVFRLLKKEAKFMYLMKGTKVLTLGAGR